MKRKSANNQESKKETATEKISQIESQPPLQSSNMEVHKHPQHVMHKKKWAEYVLEFLMIFLAVFLGFIAENIREHNVEHKKARQYALTMLQDLKADEEALHEGISYNEVVLKKLDTLLMIYQPGNRVSNTTGPFYYYGRYGFRFWYYVNKQVTLEQMKSSGTIGYFQNSSLENQIVKLDKLISFVKYRDDREALFNEQAIKYATTLFSYSVLKTIPDEDSARQEGVTQKIFDRLEPRPLQNFLQTNPALSSTQSSIMLEYLNFCNLRVNMLAQKISVYQEALSGIENLATELKKEFDLE